MFGKPKTFAKIIDGPFAGRTVEVDFDVTKITFEYPGFNSEFVPNGYGLPGVSPEPTEKATYRMVSKNKD